MGTVAMSSWQLAVPAAVDADGVLHRTADLGEHRGQLRCAGCGTAVEAVGPYGRAAGETATRVRAHFRLAAGRVHAAVCPFDFPRAAARIAHAAPEVVRPCPSGYLLAVPELPNRDFSRSSTAWRSGRGTGAGFLAGEAVNAISKIAVLLHRFGGQHAVPGAFVALRRQRRLAWPELCFDEHSYPDLIARLGMGDDAAVAVLFRAERGGQAKTGTSWWLGGISQQHTARDGELATIRVTVRSRSRRLFSGVPLGARALAYGRWQLRQPGSAPLGGRKAAAASDVVCWLNEPWQLQSVE
jgi:hypothetical protein